VDPQAKLNPTRDGTGASELETRIERRFGVLPNFFRLAPENPEITANLCDSPVSRI
jgi:hypothetical protein